MAVTDYEKRRAASAQLGHAITALASAGTLVVTARNGAPPEVQPLITAVREDISGMIDNVKAIQEELRRKNLP